MIELVHQSRIAALASLKTFLALLAMERTRGHTSQEVEIAFLADFHDELSTAYWGTGLNGSNNSNGAGDMDVAGANKRKDS